MYPLVTADVSSVSMCYWPARLTSTLRTSSPRNILLPLSGKCRWQKQVSSMTSVNPWRSHSWPSASGCGAWVPFERVAPGPRGWHKSGRMRVRGHRQQKPWSSRPRRDPATSRWWLPSGLSASVTGGAVGGTPGPFPAWRPPSVRCTDARSQLIIWVFPNRTSLGWAIWASGESWKVLAS